MTAPRQPRQWNFGDAEPLEETLFLRDCQGDVWHRGDTAWWTAETAPMSWERITKKYAPLVEVLPETPEPPREERPTGTPRVLLGWTVPSHIEAEIYQGRFWGLCLRCDGERKIALDYEAEAVAFLKDHGHGQPVEYRPMPGCCGGCGGTGAVSDPETNGKCADCYGTGHMHTGSCDPVPAPQSSPAPLLPLSAPVETEGETESVSEALSPQSETELKLWNLLDKAEQEYLASDEPCDRKSALVRAVLAEGWRPSRTPVPSSQVHVELAKTIAESAGIPQSLAATVASVLIEDEGWRPPLPADEVEPDAMQWGYREHPAEDVDPVREEYARFRAADDHLTLVQREVRYGPWVAVPVEPKETK